MGFSNFILESHFLYFKRTTTSEWKGTWNKDVLNFAGILVTLKFSWRVTILSLCHVTVLNPAGSQPFSWSENALDVFCSCFLRDLRSIAYYRKLSQSIYRDNLALHTSF